jgi:predicted AAA+ superfamily ATPase
MELPRICGVDLNNTRKIKSLLTILCASVPFQVDITKLATLSGLKRDTIINYLSYLDKAKLIRLLYSDLKNIKRMQKPDKIYIDNTNLLNAWATAPIQIGTIRETFVANQLSVNHVVEFRKTNGDFLVDSKYTFEVGGDDKDFQQIANVADSFILADDMETAIGKKLPVWVVGFDY